MNKTTKARATTGTTAIPSLGKSQVVLENAAKELRAAQKVFEQAQSRLQLAEEGYDTALVTLQKDVDALKSSTRVARAGTR
ncbi:hypothetical protein [Ralstonia phage RP13]|nr:hypothetical protein [Ralstonia phage RP13]